MVTATSYQTSHISKQRLSMKQQVTKTTSCVIQPICSNLSAATQRGKRLNLKAQAASNLASEPLISVHTDKPPIFREDWTAPEPSRFNPAKRAFIEQHRIRGSEAGPDQKTTMTAVANILQEVAGNHAVAMWGRSDEGFATDPALADRGLIFVMTRMQIQVNKYPHWGDLVEIETWFQESGKIGAQRDWVLRDAATGDILGKATSTWVMINMNTRRLSKLPDEIRRRCYYYQMDPPKDALPTEVTRRKIPDMKTGDTSGSQSSSDTTSTSSSDSDGNDVAGSSIASGIAVTPGPNQVARRSDIDMNGHINNVVYMSWAIETVPDDIYTDAHLYQIEVDFKAECYAGDEVESLVCQAETPDVLLSNGAGVGALTYNHWLRRCEGEKCTELVRARTTWRLGEA